MKKFSFLSYLFILILFNSPLLLFTNVSIAKSDLPENNMYYPVLIMTMDETGGGSGFFLNEEDAVYLITARHVLFKETNVTITKKLVLPKDLSHKFVCTEKGFQLKFWGVMSLSERDELIKEASKSKDSYLIEAIEQLYEESQNLKLNYNKIKMFSKGPNADGDICINEWELNLSDLYEKKLVKYHPSHDVAAIKIAIPIEKKVEEEKESEEEKKEPCTIRYLAGVNKKGGKGGILGVSHYGYKLFNDVKESNKVYLFGFPSSITKVNPWLDIRLPLLREGIVAGKNDLLKTIILDCPVYYGNSGGLVIESERVGFNKINHMAIGVITNFVPFQKRWFQNSGYSIVVPMDFVEELIVNFQKEDEKKLKFKQ